LYLGRWLGEPMAVSMGVRSGEMIGVYNVAVLPRGRRHGMGGAMTAHVLEEGRDTGAKTASLQASAEGLSLYQKMGFVVVGRFEHYLSASPLQWLELGVGTFLHRLKGSWERMRHPLMKG
jgi:ribosomal protein S18 acetylase RimI-like enzyme